MTNLYVGLFVLFFFLCVCVQGQILANLKALDSDWFGKNMMERSGKVRQFFFFVFMSFFFTPLQEV